MLNNELNDSKVTRKYMKLYKESLFQRKVKWRYEEIGRCYGLDCIDLIWKHANWYLPEDIF
jgi:hypothetical protein